LAPNRRKASTIRGSTRLSSAVVGGADAVLQEWERVSFRTRCGWGQPRSASYPPPVR